MVCFFVRSVLCDKMLFALIWSSLSQDSQWWQIDKIFRASMEISLDCLNFMLTGYSELLKTGLTQHLGTLPGYGNCHQILVPPWHLFFGLHSQLDIFIHNIWTKLIFSLFAAHNKNRIFSINRIYVRWEIQFLLWGVQNFKLCFLQTWWINMCN